MGTLSKLLVTHSGRPLEANAPRLISFKGLYKFFLQAEHARAQYKREILSAFFADTALSEYRRRSVAQCRDRETPSSYYTSAMVPGLVLFKAWQIS